MNSQDTTIPHPTKPKVIISPKFLKKYVTADKISRLSLIQLDLALTGKYAHCVGWFKDYMPGVWVEIYTKLQYGTWHNLDEYYSPSEKISWDDIDAIHVLSEVMIEPAIPDPPSTLEEDLMKVFNSYGIGWKSIISEEKTDDNEIIIMIKACRFKNHESVKNFLSPRKNS